MVPISKGHRRGTHRAVCPAATLERLQPRLQAAGITRVANVTGLDRIGVPVVMVVRPASRSLVVAQGKGLDLAAATASGLMESLEAWHAEQIAPDLTAPFSWLVRAADLVDVHRLPARRNSRFSDDLPIPWVAGRDLLAGEIPVFVPYPLVHTVFTAPPAAGSACFCSSTCGLASGNTREEALVHAICEAIEHDALAIWHARSSAEQAASRIEPASIDDPDALDLLERFSAADLGVAIYDATSDVGVATFHAEIMERGARLAPFFPRPVAGDGCHPARSIALLRALSEAAQSRLTYIAGARDDIRDDDYLLQPAHRQRAARRIFGQAGPQRFHDVPTFESDRFADDLAHLKDRLQQIGISQLAVVDLAQPGFDDISVVRVVIPGLEGTVHHPEVVPGPRAQREQLRVRPLAEAML